MEIEKLEQMTREAFQKRDAEIEDIKKKLQAHDMLLVDFNGEKRTPEALEFHEATMPKDFLK